MTTFSNAPLAEVCISAGCGLFSNLFCRTGQGARLNFESYDRLAVICYPESGHKHFLFSGVYSGRCGWASVAVVNYVFSSV